MGKSYMQTAEAETAKKNGAKRSIRLDVDIVLYTQYRWKAPRHQRLKETMEQLLNDSMALFIKNEDKWREIVAKNLESTKKVGKNAAKRNR